MNFQNDLKSLFHELYIDPIIGECSNEYSIKIAKFVSKYGDYQNAQYFEDLKQLIYKNDDYGFFIFNIIHTYYRRNKRYNNIKQLENSIGNEYKKRQSFPILHLRLEINVPSMNDKERLKYAKNVHLKFPNNEGVTHDYCMMIAEIFESGDEQSRNIIKKKYIMDAKKEIDIISNNNYPKYLWTKARIYSALGMITTDDTFDDYFKEALFIIKSACHNEEMGSQYSIRLSTYRNYELYIKNTYLYEQNRRKLIEIDNEITKKAEKTQKEIEELKVQNIEILGLFVAIISFTLGTLNISKTDPLLSKIVFIIILMASILVIFGCLGIAIHGSKHIIRNILICFIGVIIIGGIIYVILYCPEIQKALGMALFPRNNYYSNLICL